MPRLVYRDGLRSVYDDGTIDYGVPQPDGTLAPLPMADRAEAAFDGLKQIRDSTGTLTALQLSNAVRALAAAVIALARLYLGRIEID